VRAIVGLLAAADHLTGGRGRACPDTAPGWLARLWRHVLAAVREPARRRDRHRRLQHDDRVRAAHRAAVHESAVIGLLLGHGDAWPAGLKTGREPAAVGGRLHHDASVTPAGRGRRLTAVSAVPAAGPPDPPTSPRSQG